MVSLPCAPSAGHKSPLSFSPPVSAEVLREGDEVLEVNGVPVMGRSTDEIVRLMVSWYIATCLVCAYAVCREMCFLSFFLSCSYLYGSVCHTYTRNANAKWLIKAPKEGLFSALYMHDALPVRHCHSITFYRFTREIFA